MKYIHFLTIAVVVSGILVGCSSDEPTTDSVPEPEPELVFTDLNLSEAEGRANEGLENFNNQFFKEAFAATVEGNVSVSPLSASMLLAMTANAADAELREQILTALGSNDLTAINTLNCRYMEVLPGLDDKVTLTVANGCWYHNAYSLTPYFNRLLQENYSATISSGNFVTDYIKVAEDINSWVNSCTSGMIPEIIEDPAKLAGKVSVLADAVYVKGAWAGPFDIDKTEPAEFYGANGTTTVEMMFRDEHAYLQGGINFIAVRIPLGNANFTVTLVLPDEGVTVDELIADDIHSRLIFDTSRRAHVYLPRVDIINPTMNLNGVLSTMGIDKLEDLRELTQFTEPVMARHDIKQKTAIRFTEEGAEASAISWDTAESWNGFDRPVSKTPVFRADRPFLFFIDEATTGAALLWGCIRDL